MIDNNERFRKRAVRLRKIVLILFIVLIAQLFKIQILMHDEFKAKSEKQITSLYKETGKRGKIVASTGEDLAYDTVESDLIIDPKRFKDIPNKKEVLEFIKRFGNFSVEEELKKIDRDSEKRYYKFLENLTYNQRLDLEMGLKILKVRKKEIFFEKRNKRVYPNEDLLRHIVGFLGHSDENTEKSDARFGIEKEYDSYLDGGIRDVQKYLSANRKREIPTIAQQENKDKKNGDDVVLALDYVIQYIMQDEVSTFIKNYSPIWATAIMINPNNGEILGMVSMPSGNRSTVRNNAIQNIYEPGSIFKPLIVAAALEEGLITPTTTFPNPTSSIVIHGKTIRDAENNARGMITPQQILMKSSNVGMVQIGDRFTNAKFEEYLKKYGLYEKTGIDFANEPEPRQQPYEKWDGLKRYTMSFGQGIAVTPLQMITAFASVINGGKLLEPTLAKEIINENGISIYKHQTFEKRRVISEETSALIRNMLYETVEEGGGQNAKIEGYNIGGKTGTAQKSGKGGYQRGKYILSYSGFYPVNKPEYLLLVVANEPHSSMIYASQLMAPLFKGIMERMFRYKNILPTNAVVEKIGNQSLLVKKSMPVLSTFMPDLTGLSPREVTKLFKDRNIDIELVGKGIVENYTPSVGTDLDGIKKIKLYLKEKN
ncbi:MAG: transpeptidase family protein [Fusobacteriaceae bacterium]|nr:transpeptidase family protein [Fusobacteriaceae bacterium]